MFCSLNARPKSPAIRMACGVAWRLPTIPTDACRNKSALPRTNNTGGGVSPSFRRMGKSSSHDKSSLQLGCFSQLNAVSQAVLALPVSCHAAAACLPYRPSCATKAAGAFNAASALPQCSISCVKLSAPIYGVKASCTHAKRSVSVIFPHLYPQ